MKYFLKQKSQTNPKFQTSMTETGSGSDGKPVAMKALNYFCPIMTE